MLSNTSKYALRAAIYLALKATPDQKCGIKEISGELDIPSPFLAKILQGLVKHDILVSAKGPHGGFCLKKSPLDISVMEIVEVIDGTGTFDRCVIGTSNCQPDHPCSMHHKLAPLRKEMKHMLQTETLADLVSAFHRGANPLRL
ncbi:MAG: Rrf2 family transcriptional regulator [Bacteroidales bacterium]